MVERWPQMLLGRAHRDQGTGRSREGGLGSPCSGRPGEGGAVQRGGRTQQMVEMVSGLQVGSWWAFVHMALSSRERQGGGGRRSRVVGGAGAVGM